MIRLSIVFAILVLERMHCDLTGKVRVFHQLYAVALRTNGEKRIAHYRRSLQADRSVSELVFVQPVNVLGPSSLQFPARL